MMTRARLAGTGSYLPETVVTNQDMSGIVDTSDEWIVSRTGISERRLSSGESTWHMGAQAGREALAASGLRPEDIDLVIATTVTPDYYTPSLACIIQAELGIRKAPCVDLGAACTGFVYAMDAAARYLATGGARNVLVVSSETLSKIVDYRDRTTCVLFGDGAGAVVLSAVPEDSDEPGARILSSCLGAEGESGGFIVSRALSIDHPFILDADAGATGRNRDRFGCEGERFLRMEGQEVYKFAVRVLQESLQKAVEKAGLTVEDLDWVVPHQANIRILETAARRLGLPMERMVVEIAGMGNASSASIPVCLDRMVRDGRLVRGQTLGLVGFGGGLTYGALLLQY